VNAQDVVETAAGIVEKEGLDALTMRRLSDELGVAVTSIYWHVGNREALLDALVDRVLTEMGTLKAIGRTPRDRIASLARQLRTKMLERPHLIALVHEQSKTALMFRPVQAAMAVELAALGTKGAAAARSLRALQMHVIASVLLERSIERYPTVAQPVEISSGVDDPELDAALAAGWDRVEVFEFGLQALLTAL
jgi:TetR/AcrR family transcriptional regulator, tetracycline repressor protein